MTVHLTAIVTILGRRCSASATFSPCDQYRYQLDRVWDVARPRLAWIMLNPSTADHQHTDPTVFRCVKRAMGWGFGGCTVVNLFALRATDPRALRRHAEPVGGLANDHAIAAAVAGASLVIAAWGVHGTYANRCQRVGEDVVVCQGRRLHALTLTRDGTPGHPLYVPLAQRPFVWWSPPSAADAPTVLPCDDTAQPQQPQQALLAELAPTDAPLSTFPTP